MDNITIAEENGMAATIPGTTYPERRAECLEHEGRIDKMGAEVHRFNGYFAIIGGSIGVGCMICGWFGSNINNKLDTIQSSLNTHAVAMAQLDGRIKSCETDIIEIKARHINLDNNGVIRKMR